MNHFENIILTGRAGAGKSEFIDFLKHVPKEERLLKYHIGDFKELDDFLWVWDMGVDDDIWESLGKGRYHTTKLDCGYTESHDMELILTDFMSKKMNNELVQRYADNAAFYVSNTLFVEFARGGKDPFKRTFNYFDEKVLKQSCVFYIDNTAEESERRNEARYNAQLKRSILAHKVPDPDMQLYYRTNDWKEVSQGKTEGYLNFHGVKVPFVSVWNIPELTDPKKIEERFAPAVVKLWDLNTKR